MTSPRGALLLLLTVLAEGFVTPAVSAAPLSALQPPPASTPPGGAAPPASPSAPASPAPDASRAPDASPEPSGEPAREPAAAPAPPVPPDPAVQAALEADRAAGLTTDVREPTREPLELAYHLFALPEYVIELAFTPLGFVVGLVERYRIDRRVIDVLRNDSGTVKVVPTAKFSGGDGLGAGASLKLQDLFGHDERFKIGGLIQLNSDYTLKAAYEQAFASLDGRVVLAELEQELNSDLDYYGIGNETDVDDKRSIRRNGIDGHVTIDLFDLGSYDTSGLASIGYRRSSLTGGTEVGTPPLEEMDVVTPTADFGETSNYALLGATLRHDSRDTVARTSRGLLAEASARVSAGLDGADRAAAGLRGEVTTYVPLLPMNRVLVVWAGVEGVVAPTADDTIPLEDYVVLGRKHRLRGFDNDRFRDRLGWWSGAEYRYPIFRYKDSPFVMSPSIFVDVGRVGHDIPDLWKRTFHWDAGVGISGESETDLIFRIELGYSVEGFQTGINLGKEL